MAVSTPYMNSTIPILAGKQLFISITPIMRLNSPYNMTHYFLKENINRNISLPSQVKCRYYRRNVAVNLKGKMVAVTLSFNLHRHPVCEG